MVEIVGNSKCSISRSSSITMAGNVTGAADLISAIREKDFLKSTRVLAGGQALSLRPSLWQEIGADGTGSTARFNNPRGVAVDSNGNVYVADYGNSRIQYFTAVGSYLGQWSIGAGYNLYGIAVAPGGNVYVAEFSNDRISYYTPGGSFLGRWGSTGVGNGQLLGPTAVALGPDGDVYVAELVNARVQHFTATGSYLGRWGSMGPGNGQFNNPYGLCLNVTGTRVYVADSLNERIQFFNHNEPGVAPASLGRVKAAYR